jgi:AcrR family transcriptional regulator
MRKMGLSQRQGPMAEKELRTRPRRAPGEGRQLLLAAGREVFAERGYSGASTREIADRAGLAETLLFRNFGSKAQLYSAILGELLNDFLKSWREVLDGIEPRTPEHVIPEFVGHFYDFFRENRGLMFSYFASSVFEPEIISLDRSPVFVEALDTLLRWSQYEFPEIRNQDETYLLITNRAMAGMILSTALFDDWLGVSPAEGSDEVGSDGRVRPTRNEIVAVLTDFVLYPIRPNSRSTPDSTAPPPLRPVKRVRTGK